MVTVYTGYTCRMIYVVDSGCKYEIYVVIYMQYTGYIGKRRYAL